MAVKRLIIEFGQGVDMYGGDQNNAVLKAMVLVRSEKDALTINGKTYDKLHYGICYSSMVKRVEHIKKYEQILDRVNCILDQSPDVKEDFESIRTDVQKLEEYYCSPEWKEDYDAEAAGRLPADLKRGVLSQDGIDHALERFRELSEQKN